MSLTPLHLWHIFFVLLAMNGLLLAELKFNENISDAGLCVFCTDKYQTFVILLDRYIYCGFVWLHLFAFHSETLHDFFYL